MSEPLSPPFRVQIRKLSTTEGKCPGPTAGGGGAGLMGRGLPNPSSCVWVCLTSDLWRCSWSWLGQGHSHLPSNSCCVQLGRDTNGVDTTEAAPMQPGVLGQRASGGPADTLAAQGAAGGWWRHSWARWLPT